jgi:hypothetical protein
MAFERLSIGLVDRTGLRSLLLTLLSMKHELEKLQYVALMPETVPRFGIDDSDPYSYGALGQRTEHIFVGPVIANRKHKTCRRSGIPFKYRASLVNTGIPDFDNLVSSQDVDICGGRETEKVIDQL